MGQLVEKKGRSSSADFLQINDQSTIAIESPEKMRVTYDAPDEKFIVADGSMAHMWDDEMGQQLVGVWA
ncbi:MAG: outer-membrane lipoprotein carrier protein LolA [Alphaproteobacteria bacterium]|nr:outer-membrane lipoprotein carrier protein LolA [Alphaproteobacteria bacterium]